MREKLKVHDGDTPGKAFEVKIEYPKPKVATMSKELVCPFCNETELEKGIELQGGGFILGCPKCKKFAHDIFWQELIRTRKALEIAVDALNAVTATPLNSRVIHDVANKALEQITALEQKDVK